MKGQVILVKRHCSKCDKLVNAKVITKKRTYSVNGEDYDVNAQVLVCNECGEEMLCKELDETALEHVRNLYLERHGCQPQDDDSDDLVKQMSRFLKQYSNEEFVQITERAFLALAMKATKSARLGDVISTLGPDTRLTADVLSVLLAVYMASIFEMLFGRDIFDEESDNNAEI